MRADGGGEFISNALKLYCQKRGIKIGYAAPYIYKENGMAERCWKTLATMKDALLIDSGLPINCFAGQGNYFHNTTLSQTQLLYKVGETTALWVRGTTALQVKEKIALQVRNITALRD